jgi:hypothetical protein
MKIHGEVEVKLHVFLTSTVVGLTLANLTPGKESVWATEPVWMQWRREEILSMQGIIKSRSSNPY